MHIFILEIIINEEFYLEKKKNIFIIEIILLIYLQIENSLWLIYLISECTAITFVKWEKSQTSEHPDDARTTQFKCV